MAKLTINEVKEAIEEVLSERRKILSEAQRKLTILEGRKARLDELMSEKGSFLKTLGRKLGRVDPSADVDDPARAQKAIDRSLGAATKIASGFQASALNTTKAINQFHSAVKDSMDKVTSLADSLGPDKAAAYQKKLIELIKNYYSLLDDEADRIDSYLKTIKDDLESKGLDRRLAYMDVDGKKEAR